MGGGGGAQDVNVLNFPAVQAVSGVVDVANFPATQPVTGTVSSEDTYVGGQTLPDQTSGGSALTFTFSAPVQLAYAFFKTTLGTSTARVDPFGGTASATQGIPLDDGVPQAFPVQTSTLSVFAPIGVTVSVWGYRYA
jgi:hypothetical protein